MSASCRVKSAFSSAVSSRWASAAMRSTSADVSVGATAGDAIMRRSPRFARATGGSWNPGSQARLAEAVDAPIAAASDSSRSCPRAIIAPHAGLMYSGPVAAYAYRLVRQCAYTAVVLVGAAPPGGVDGGAGWGRGAGGTP